jgi:hypothetical protein
MAACMAASAAPAMALPGRARAIDRVSARHRHNLHRPVHPKMLNFGRNRAGPRCAAAGISASGVTFNTRGGSGRLTFCTRAVVDASSATLAQGRDFTFLCEF